MSRFTEKIINRNTGEILAYRLLNDIRYLKAIQKLGEMEDACEEHDYGRGQFVFLPSLEGDPVFEIVDNEIKEIHPSEDWIFANRHKFGKTCFCTLHEAGDALRNKREIRYE